MQKFTNQIRNPAEEFEVGCRVESGGRSSGTWSQLEIRFLLFSSLR